MLDRLVITLGEKLAWLFLLSVVVSLIEIVLRYLFNSPTIWAHETTVLFCAICFIYGGSWCLAQDSHIRINVVYDLFGPRLQAVIDIISLVLCAVYLVAMSYAAWFVARSSLFGPTGNWRPETSGSAWDPAFPAVIRTVLFIVLVLMLLQVLVQILKRIASRADA